MLTGKRLAKALANAAHHKLAIDIELLEVKKICSYASFFLMVSGKNKMHLEAIKEGILDTLDWKEAHVIAIEGKGDSGWIIVDAGETIVHIFHPTQRSYYNLFGLWGDAPSVPLTFSEKPPAPPAGAAAKKPRKKKKSDSV